MKLALLGLCVLAFACAGSASGIASVAPLAAPSGLHGFVYRANEQPVARSYTQLPAFAWEPVGGAARYEIQLATSGTFAESTMLVDDSTVATPVTSLQMQVPWMTGQPYALWVRVRALRGTQVSRWSAPFGFNTSWKEIPSQLPAPNGLIRWKPVEGASAYEVWFPDIALRFRTLTNVADEREYWMLMGAGGARVIHWRVRALRYVKDAKLPNKIQVVTYGPYSPRFTSINNTALLSTPLQGTHTVSDVDSTQQPHALMPAFAWNGNGNGLSRVYIFSDRGCVNSVTVGSLVNGPAWAPRFAPPLALPTAAGGQASYGAQANAEMTDYTKIVTAEEAGSSPSSSSGAGGSASPSAGSDPSFTTDPGTIELPDIGWPSGRYWWTVVPVQVLQSPTGDLVYRDAELPQDACAAGRVWSFGIQSMPVTKTENGGPFASGQNGSRVVSAATKTPSFVQLPVITWTPVLGAQAYEIQLSRRLYPWHTEVTQAAVVPSVTLKLTKQQSGTWYYRVRGINGYLPGTAIKMTWSTPAALRISGDRFVVVK
jgi:hypothetical protein